MKNLITAPNLMIAGVAAIGVYAAYRLIKAKSEDVRPEGEYGNLALLGDPLKLSTNRFYRARLRVRESGAAPFLSTSSRDTLVNAMKVLGFSEVKVFMNAGELPKDWPASTTKNAGPLTRWFQGQWRLPSASVPRPPDIEAIWMTKPPEGATFVASVRGLTPIFEEDVIEEEALVG